MLTFRKLLCLAVFLIAAYTLQLTFANSPATPALYGLALLAAAVWLARELTGLYRNTPRPPFLAPQRGLSRADYQYWLNSENVRRERANYHGMLFSIGVAAMLVIVALGFVAWQASHPLVPSAVAPLVVLAIAAVMLFYAGGLKRLRLFNLA